MPEWQKWNRFVSASLILIKNKDVRIMKDEIDIYNYRKILENEIARIRNSTLSSRNKKLILEYKDYLIARGLSLARTIKCIWTLRVIALMIEKPFTTMNKNDIMKLVNKIEEKEISAYSKHDYKLIFKQFYKWLKDAEEYPDEIKWIKVKKPSNRMLPEELLTIEEVKVMTRCVHHPRDKAFIEVLYESACRIGEMLKLKIKHVHPDQYGAQLIVDGKTGPRRIRIMASSPLLMTWLNNHPFRENPDAPVWVCIGTKEWGKPLGHNGAVKILKDAAKKAGIKKRIYPHLFRHSRLTELARLGFNEFQLRTFAGWTMDSDEAAVYVHMSGKDVDEALLRINGIENKQKDEEKFKPVECVRCSVKNSPDAKYCNGCGLAFDLKYAIAVDHRKEEIKDKIDTLAGELAKSPEVVNMLLKAVATLKNKN